ncbi:hypothetical protein HMPREF9120_01097 [Neisseria sp. oral taxon 020 str. F0370]|nr:hypothetical protein CGZ77_05555 [Neisseria sp. KEM232]EKY07235.1 hypothetical protein HMPREF9120_01097 [Neisseria sp. oral taxon 020 str. F0370]
MVFGNQKETDFNRGGRAVPPHGHPRPSSIMPPFFRRPPHALLPRFPDRLNNGIDLTVLQPQGKRTFSVRYRLRIGDEEAV